MPRVPRPFLLVPVLLLPVLSACQEADRPQLIASAHAEAKGPALPAFRYVTRLSPLDHLDVDTGTLEDLAAVLRRDRERFHAGLGDKDDEKDPVLANKYARLRFEELAAASNLDESLLMRNAKVRVEFRDNRVTLTVLDPGDTEPACLLDDGMLNHVRWDAPRERITLSQRWLQRGWKLATRPDAVQFLRSDGTAVATFERTSDGPDSLRLEGPTCSTAYGVRIGATLAEAKLDPQIKQASCNCQDGNNVILWASNQAFTYQYRIDATCKKPVKCMASDTDVMCPTAIGRKDCTITSILVQPAAG